MGLIDWIIVIAVAAIFVTCIAVIIRRKKSGKSSCGCGCESCPHGAICHGKTEKKDK